MSSAPRVLVLLPQSPYSERARWALDHHHLSYEVRVHEPFVGERRLRRLLKTPPGVRATVPVLLADGQVLTEGWDIARYADRCGSSDALIPRPLESQVRRLVSLADRGGTHARALVTAALFADASALSETLPGSVPGFLRPALFPLARYGVGWFARKYGVDPRGTSGARQGYAQALQAAREQLAGGEYMLGRFTFADVALACLLQAVEPVSDRFIALGPALRRVWSQPELAEEFADLLAWRDRMYAKHRSQPRSRELADAKAKQERGGPPQAHLT